MARRIAEVQAGALPWLVLEAGGRLCGYAYASKWRARPGYRHAVESSVYVDPAMRGRGYGLVLYRALLAQLEGRFHTVIGGIALPNAASIALHEKLGFRQVACFHEVGHKFGNWVDVGYWQLTLP
jgi:phosphinothricin acetyltransferase